MTNAPPNTNGLFCWDQIARSPARCEPLYARPFGVETVDLEILFSADPRPVLITQLLRRCLYSSPGQRFQEDDLWKGKEDTIKYIPLQAREGDLAVFLQKGAVEVMYEGDKYFIVPQASILMLEREEDIG